MKVRLLVHLPALSPCLSLQAKPWWRWIRATRRPHGAAPAPRATTGARTASAAAATASVRPALAPCSRVRIWGALWDPHSLSCLLSRGLGALRKLQGVTDSVQPPLLHPSSWEKPPCPSRGLFMLLNLCLPDSVFGFGTHYTIPIPGSGTTTGLREPYCSARDRTQVACARPEPCWLHHPPDSTYSEADPWCVGDQGVSRWVWLRVSIQGLTLASSAAQ